MKMGLWRASLQYNRQDKSLEGILSQISLLRNYRSDDIHRPLLRRDLQQWAPVELVHSMTVSHEALNFSHLADKFVSLW